MKQRRRTDVFKFRLIKNTRCRIYPALNGRSKSPSTKEILGVNNGTYRKRIEYQFTPEMKSLNTETDHVKPIFSLDKSSNDDLKETFYWKRNSTEKNSFSKGTKYFFPDFQLQFFKAYKFLRIKEEGLNKNLHQ